MCYWKIIRTMKIKKCLKIALYSLLLCTLCGCGKLESHIKIRNPEDIVTSGVLTIASDALKQLNYTPQQLLEILKKAGIDLTKEQFTIGEADENGIITINYSYNGSSYVQVKKEGNILRVRVDTSLLHNVDTDVFGKKSYDYSFLKDYDIELSLFIEMPGRIKEYSDGELIDRQTLKINFLEDNAIIELSAYAYDYLTLFIIIAFFSIVASLFLLKKTKKRYDLLNLDEQKDDKH